ncbi:hypothetical protein [Sulfobacillus harzensis]|uniref:Ferritin-like domain-containing protein n=1 Tax=Sulfobacillus harzensis TaxID=2729629 RepID=A0A7Y0L4X6_9FIRM|nr:hypothetical protein [Sulfobacillus harzensis]
MIKIFPQFEEDLLIRLFHKGVKAQWTVADVEWEQPLMMQDDEARALAHMLTPVYLGEQSAMIGASVVLPQMAMAGETTSQIYLSSFLMDEARHFEVLTRLYKRLEEDPLNVRQMPAMLRYHNRLRKGDRIDWVWGILISDVFAKNFYQIFSRSQPEALFGSLSGRILQDESRHQAFAEHYLKRAVPTLEPERLGALVKMKDDLLDTMDNMYDHLLDDAKRLNIDGRKFLDDLRAEIEHKAHRIGLDQPHGDDDGAVKRVFQGIGEGVKTARQDVSNKFQALKASRCDTCFVALLCRTRLVTAARCV